MTRPTRWSRFAVRLALGLAVAVGVAVKLMDDRYPWLWAYLADQLHPPTSTVQAAAGPTHVMFTFVDHFEPHEQKAMDHWMTAYPAMANRHRDGDGRHPQHTWFWYFAKSDGAESLRFLRQLSQLTYDGYGEVELHLHHFNDNEQTFLEKITRMIRLSQATGAMITAEPRPRTTFGFIHGMWALDNSRHGKECGVNNEITLLKRLHCYADFTHPSWGPMHPRTVNRLYYVTDDPLRPKSYDWGTPMHVGGSTVGDLLIFEGPSVVRLNGWRPTYYHGDITMEDLPTPERIDAWVRTGVHVQGRPEWVFIKVFTHGAVPRDDEAVLGAWADHLHGYLEEHYNDGTRYVLHYVTTREAYNIAKAAEAGKSGNPNDYRNFSIPPYANRLLVASVPYDLVTVDRERLIARFLTAPGTRVEVRLRAPDVAIVGDATAVATTPTGRETAASFTTIGEGLIEFDLQPHAFAAQAITGGGT